MLVATGSNPLWRFRGGPNKFNEEVELEWCSGILLPPFSEPGRLPEPDDCDVKEEEEEEEVLLAISIREGCFMNSEVLKFIESVGGGEG